MSTKPKKATRTQIDLYATLALHRAAIDKELRELRPLVIARGEGLQAGHVHTLNVLETHTVSLSVSLAKSVMSADQIAQATVVSDSVRITVEA